MTKSWKENNGEDIISEFRISWKLFTLGIFIYINFYAWDNYAVFRNWNMEDQFGYFLSLVTFLGIQTTYWRFSKNGFRSGVKILNKSFERQSLIPWRYNYLDVGGIWPFYSFSFITFIPWHWNFFFTNFGRLIVFIDEEVSCELMDADSRCNFKKYADKYRKRSRA